MRKTILSNISLLLVVIMLITAIASCGGNKQNETTKGPDAETTENVTTSTNVPTESTEKITEETTGTTEEKPTVEYDGKYADVIKNANTLANTIQEYRSNAKGDSYILENMNMQLEYTLKSSKNQLVSSLVNSEGKSYIENTFDAFVRVKNGNTYYSSLSTNELSTNTFRFGYYYDEFRIEGQNFVNGFDVSKEHVIDLNSQKNSGKTNMKVKMKGDILTAEIKGSDPYFSFEDLELPTSEYAYLQVTMKTSDDNASGSIYVAAGQYAGANAIQIIGFDILPADDEYHTYTIYLGSVKDYTNLLHSVRIDFNGMEDGRMVEISDMRVISAEESGISSLSTARIFHIYSDKLHHELQVVAHSITSDIAAIGMRTDIAADTVEKLIVKDKNGLHETLEGVDWASAEYIGFDIKGVGIFGYILPVDETTGTMTVTLDDGKYVIMQERAPANGTVIPGNNSDIGNANDFFMGQRIYTDENHEFSAFLREAEIERNPLTAKNIKVSTVYSDNGSYLGYDAIRGCYTFAVDAGGFNYNYYKAQNKHYELKVTIKGDQYNRNIYILNTAGNSGELECAAILDENLMMLPIPLEVGKNFSGDGDNNIYDQLDSRYSEVIFPISLDSEEMFEFSLLNLYQNWGRYPLKQASWIEFFAPYYHLSTGVTETNCISYERPGSMLPDHRAMSAPMWLTQPQHTSGGGHEFLNYMDNNGGSQGLYSTYKEVGSYGPTYANVTTGFMSSDGKIYATLDHMEMPQLDENRAYYTITYDFLEDISFNDFKQQVNLYSVTDNSSSGIYQLFGYLNENNEPTIVDANINGPEKLYVLGNECPYFDYCNMKGSGDYVNLSFIICNSEIIIGGEKVDAGFVVREGNLYANLSLNIGSVDFKAGDKFTIYALITPWGSQESDYSGTSFAPDQNVRDMRENSALDPFKATAGENAEIIKSAFLPSIKTTNGQSAEFTISGGHDNVAIRVYGFTDLSIPKVYEKINGEWVAYDISSANYPDTLGYKYNYDGYNVYYDADGTFSYAFVTTITDGAPRTFKVETDSEFDKWGRIEIVENELSPYNVYLNSQEIARAAKTWPMFSSIKPVTEGSTEFVSLHGTPKGNESYFPPFYNTFDATTGECEIVTGQYIVVKYRIPTSNPDTLPYLQFFASTEEASATGRGDNITVPLNSGVYADDQWHVLIVDLSKSGMSAIVPNEDGTYSIQHIRFDVFNIPVNEQTHVDLVYFAIHDNLEEIYAANTDMSEVTLYQNKTAITIDPSTGKAK